MGWKSSWLSRALAAVIPFATAISYGNAQSVKAADAGKPPALTKPAAAATGRTDRMGQGAEFELGVGDVIHISVWREPELTQTAVVRPDGRVSLPLAGEVPVAGKTALDAQALIRTLLLKYVTDPQVTVSVSEIHSRQVFITGQVQRPGAYPLIGSCNVLQLIASAGGLTPYAHKKRIVVLDAQSNPVAQFDYTSAIKGNSRQMRDLKPGETVVVP
jgi:polysaccharide export outer membrane protein